MSRIRAELSKRNEYWISKHAFYTVYHFALQYNEWRDEHDRIAGGLKGVSYDGMPHGSGISNPTEAAAIRGAELASKMRLIEETAERADADLSKYILKAVTNEGITYDYLRGIMDIPCGHNQYYNARRRFYFLLAQKMNIK